jgi:hypothetical protein
MKATLPADFRIQPNPVMFPLLPKDSGESLDRKRTMITNIVVTLAKQSSDVDELLGKLKDVFGTELSFIGKGASRKTWELPYALVLKMSYHLFDNTDQNDGEIQATATYPDIACKIYGSYKSDDWRPEGIRYNTDGTYDEVELQGINIIVAERAKSIIHQWIRDTKVLQYANEHPEFFITEREYNKALSSGKLESIRWMDDAHMGNIGLTFTGKWVMLDLGIN